MFRLIMGAKSFTLNALELPPRVIDAVIQLTRTRINLPALFTHKFNISVERAGDRYRCACPFASTTPGVETTCSAEDGGDNEPPQSLFMTLADTGWFWLCHSCKRHGDALDSVGILESRGWLSSARVLCKLAGTEHVLDDTPPRPLASNPKYAEDPARVHEIAIRGCSRDARLLESASTLNTSAALVWRRILASQNQGQGARAYLKKRGVTDEQINRYAIGYAPSSGNPLTSELLRPERALDLVDAIDLGLVTASKRDARIFDTFRGRIMWPYVEPASTTTPARISGFAGRSLVWPHKNPRVPKCLNSRTVHGVWSKSSALIGMYQATVQLKRDTDDRHIVVSEGPQDILAFDRAGLISVAPYGAAFTEQHAARLYDLVDHVTLGIDSDATGRASVLSGVAALTAVGFVFDQIRVACPEVGDPGDTSADDLRRLHDNAPLALEFIDGQLLTDEAFIAKLQRTKVLAFLSALPSEAACDYLPKFGLPESSLEAIEHRHAERLASNDFFLSSQHELASAILNQPEVVSYMDATKVYERLEVSPSAVRRVAGLHFNVVEQPDRWSERVTKAWASCKPLT